MTNEDFQHLAEAIVKDFPTEAVPTYYIPAIPKKLSRVGKSVISRGKLVDKYRNKLRLLKRIRVGNPLAEITNFQTTESSDPSSDEGTRQFFFKYIYLKFYSISNGLNLCILISS